MSKIICYIPTYSPSTEADMDHMRPYVRLTQEEIKSRIAAPNATAKPEMYFDAIDSILNVRPDIKLVVGDGRSTDSIREEMKKHHLVNKASYDIMFYPDKMSQWVIFNDVLKHYATEETEYFIYSSSDVIWHMDWVKEAINAFEKDPTLKILFPCVNKGDPNLPCQIESGPRDLDPIMPPFQTYARAPCLNAYAMIFRMDFLRLYDGYPTLFRNCFTESFLYYMCEALGGEMRLLPRGHVFHHGEGDKWTDNGSPYYYNEEKFIFQDIMNRVLMFKAMGQMTPEFLKKTLYK